MINTVCWKIVQYEIIALHRIDRGVSIDDNTQYMHDRFSVVSVLLHYHHKMDLFYSVAEPHHFYAAPAPGKNFDAAPAPAPTLLYNKAKFLKLTKV
jgi:hypothetical protein